MYEKKVVFGDFWSPSRPRRTLPQQLYQLPPLFLLSSPPPFPFGGVEVYLENQEEEEEEEGGGRDGRSVPFSVYRRVPRQAEQFDRFSLRKKKCFKGKNM